MEVEDVTGIGFTTRRATEQQRHLTISHSLLCEVIVDDKRMLSVVSKMLPDRASCGKN